MARNGGKKDNSLSCAFHFESEFRTLLIKDLGKCCLLLNKGLLLSFENKQTNAIKIQEQKKKIKILGLKSLFL